MSKTVLVSTVADRRAIDCAEVLSCEQFIKREEAGGTVLIEPTFLDFRGAGNSQLGYPFMAVGHAQTRYDRIGVFLYYTMENARQFKGYVLDLRAKLESTHSHLEVMTLPLVTCGVPISGTTLVIKASKGPWEPALKTEPVMPDKYFPGMLAHVLRNRPNFPINVSSRFIGAVRSDLNLLPPLNAWSGRSLMVEYQRERTTEITRMTPEHVGQLFGVKPAPYTDDLAMILPHGVVEAFSNAE